MIDHTQHADVSGSGHIVVQIVGDGNAVTVSGAVGLKLSSYRNAAFSEAPADAGKKGEPGFTQTGRRETRVLSPYNRSTLPFVGRDEMLADLESWLNVPAQISVQVLVGAGGRGKTRLATELVDRAAANDWTAGFAEREQLDIFRAAGCETKRDAPCLVVVDYASGKLDPLVAWLRALANETGDRPKLRILLLERTGGPGSTWWRNMFEQGGLKGEAVADLLAPQAPLLVAALSTPEERHQVFASTFRAASEGAVPALSVGLDQSLQEVSLGGEPLFIAMFGLVAARQGLHTASMLTADKIARDLAKEELARISRVYGSYQGLPVSQARPFDAHLAALATLSKGWNEEETHSAIDREATALKLLLPNGSEPVRTALYAALLGEAGGVSQILPDILGEAVAMTALEGLPDKGVEAVRRAVEAKPYETTASVIRACQDFLIRGERTPKDWIEALRAQATDIEALMAFADALPHETLELREIAAEVTEDIVNLVRQLPESEQRKTLLLADKLNDLSRRVYLLGHFEKALENIHESIEIQRVLTEQEPDKFNPNLAFSLNNLSNCLLDLERWEEAKTASEEAVEIHRVFAARRPSVFEPYLAQSLSNLAGCLLSVNHGKDALPVIKEALDIFRSLAEKGSSVFETNLVGLLDNYSNCLFQLERPEEARVSSNEAVEIYRRLVSQHPDEFLPNLATSLKTLSHSLMATGNTRDALPVIKEAVEIRRRLAEQYPEVFQLELAASLNNLSNCLGDLGDQQNALLAIKEALEIVRTLMKQRPIAVLPKLAQILNSFSNRLEKLGCLEEALVAGQEALEICRALAAQRSDEITPFLALVLNNVASRLFNLYREKEALEHLEEVVNLRRGLVAKHPELFQADLGLSLSNLAFCLVALERREEALTAIEEAIGIYRVLDTHRPGSFTEALAEAIRYRSYLRKN